MYGIENINANNGWSMAVVGASIVFAGLIVLSFVISQIHKLLDLWENRDNYFKKSKAAAAVETAPPSADIKERQLPDTEALTSIYRPLVEQLPQPFQLAELYQLSQKMDLPHPHLSIKSLRDAGILISEEGGLFRLS